MNNGAMQRECNVVPPQHSGATIVDTENKNVDFTPTRVHGRNQSLKVDIESLPFRHQRSHSDAGRHREKEVNVRINAIFSMKFSINQISNCHSYILK